jgi:hypothetical protein
MAKMKFWIPDNSKHLPGPGGRLVPAKQVDPNWWQVPVEPGRATKVVSVGGRRITLNGGYYETADPEEVRVLMTDATVRCIPEDAVALGILSLADIQKLGVTVSVDGIKAKLAAKGLPTDLEEIPRNQESVAAEANPKPPRLPDFDTMKREDLVDWAMGDDSEVTAQRLGDPIHLPSTWSRERMVERIKKTLRERGDTRM